ncbi:MAG: hypothetical protein R3A79_17400 [Nannocystaceae bacterium]
MTRAPRGGPRILLAALVVCSACDETGPLEVIEGEYIDYMWDRSLTPCAGTASAVDATIPWIAAQLGHDADALGPLEYRWLPPEVVDDLYNGDTPVEYIGGYARRGYTNVGYPTSPHELTHLVDIGTRSARARPHPLLAEGLAVAFDEGLRGDRGPALSAIDPRPFIDGPLPRDLSHYPAAGSFVAYILGRYGVERFYELWDALPADAEGERFREVFTAVYGEALDPLIDDFLTGATCPADAVAVPLPPSCAAPTIPWESAETWSYRRALACGDDDVFGDADGAAAHQVTVEVAVAGTYDVSSVGDAWQGATLKPCAPCPWIRERVGLQGGSKRRVELAAGRYAVLFTVAGDTPALAGFVMTRVAP